MGGKVEYFEKLIMQRHRLQRSTQVKPSNIGAMVRDKGERVFSGDEIERHLPETYPYRLTIAGRKRKRQDDDNDEDEHKAFVEVLTLKNNGDNDAGEALYIDGAIHSESSMDYSESKQHNDVKHAVVAVEDVVDVGDNGSNCVVDPKEAERQFKLQEAVSEILRTERSYVEGLKTMVKFYIEPIEKSIATNSRKSPDYIGVESSDISRPMREMFEFIKNFAVPFHEDILKRLLKSESFPQVFLHVGDFMKA